MKQALGSKSAEQIGEETPSTTTTITLYLALEIITCYKFYMSYRLMVEESARYLIVVKTNRVKYLGTFTSASTIIFYQS